MPNKFLALTMLSGPGIPLIAGVRDGVLDHPCMTVVYVSQGNYSYYDGHQKCYDPHCRQA